MQLKELRKVIRNIIKVDPEANESVVWAVSDHDNNVQFRINYIGFDKKHKPPRITLEA